MNDRQTYAPPQRDLQARNKPLQAGTPQERNKPLQAGIPQESTPQESTPQAGVRGSIPLRDKMIMHLQEQADCKKKQLKEDYKRLKESVKDNPYLQVAVDEYDHYFSLQRKQLDALKKLLKTIDGASDQWQIKREMAALEKNLA